MIQEEETLFSRGGIRVTKTKFINPLGDVYLIRNISAVKIRKKRPNFFWPIVLILIGAFPMYLGLTSGKSEFVLIGLPFVIGGFALLLFRKTKYFIMLTTNAGTSQVTVSKDPDLIQSAVNAIHNAISFIQ